MKRIRPIIFALALAAAVAPAQLRRELSPEGMRAWHWLSLSHGAGGLLPTNHAGVALARAAAALEGAGFPAAFTGAPAGVERGGFTVFPVSVGWTARAGRRS